MNKDGEEGKSKMRTKRGLSEQQRRRGTTIVGVVIGGLLAVFGLFLLVGGINSLSSAPQCEGQTMEQGDSCVSIQESSSSTLTYQGQQDAQQGQGIVLLVFGALLTLGGGACVIGVLRENAKTSFAPPKTIRPATLSQTMPPPTFEELMSQGKKQFQAQSYSAALTNFRTASAKKPWDTSAYYYCAQTLTALKDWPAALKAFEHAVATALLPQDKQIILDVSYQKAILLKDMKQYSQALEALNDLLSLDLENMKALALRAELLTLLQQ